MEIEKEKEKTKSSNKDVLFDKDKIWEEKPEMNERNPFIYRKSNTFFLYNWASLVNDLYFSVRKQ